MEIAGRSGAKKNRRGLTEGSDKWTVKAIFEVPLQQKAGNGK